MLVAVPIGRFRRPTPGPCILSLQGKDAEELAELFKFWRELPYELLSVEKTIESFLQFEGWKLISPYEVGLTPLKDDMPEGYVRRGTEVSLKTRPEQYREMFTHLVFERYIERDKDDGSNRVCYSDCFGSLVDCSGPEGQPSVRISKEKVLKAHSHCERILAVELARLSIDPNDFLMFGTKVRGMTQIPDYYCVEQRNGEYELPDLSAVTDTVEVKMLEKVFVACKQLESHLSMAQPDMPLWGIAADEPPAVDSKIIEWAEDIKKDQRLDLEGKSTRHGDRKNLYAKVSQRKRDNPDDHAKAVEYIESQKPKV